jgi:hypothetical protein
MFHIMHGTMRKRTTSQPLVSGSLWAPPVIEEDVVGNALSGRETTLDEEVTEGDVGVAERDEGDTEDILAEDELKPMDCLVFEPETEDATALTEVELVNVGPSIVNAGLAFPELPITIRASE